MNRPLPLFIPVLSFLSPSSSSASPPRLPSPCLPLLPLPLPLFPIPLPIFRPATPGTNSHYEKPRQSKSLRQAPAKQKERGLPRDSPLQMRINLCYLKIFLPTPSPDPLPGSRSEIQARIRCPDRGRKSKPGSVARTEVENPSPDPLPGFAGRRVPRPDGADPCLQGNPPSIPM